MRRSIKSHPRSFAEEGASPTSSANVKRSSKYVDLVLSLRVALLFVDNRLLISGEELACVVFRCWGALLVNNFVVEPGSF